MTAENTLTIAVVGPCASGKTTLIHKLHEHGYPARQIAQEHSFVPDMWRRLAAPQILIYLDVGLQQARQRRSHDLSPSEHDEQHRRLEHARQHADLYIDTDGLTPNEVAELTLRFLQHHLPGAFDL